MTRPASTSPPFARGDFHPDSDVDLLVELQTLSGHPVDLVPRGGLKPIIRDQVLGEAVREIIEGLPAEDDSG